MMKQVAEQEKKQQQAQAKQQKQKDTIENLHLYIPYAFDNVSKEQMRENLSGFGKIKVIDFVAKLDKKNMNYNSAYIYFECWYPTLENKKIQAQIRQYTKSQNKSHSFKLNYDGNLHWIILENTSPSAHPKQDRKAMIDLKTEQEPMKQEPAKQVSIDDINTEKYEASAPLRNFDETMIKEMFHEMNYEKIKVSTNEQEPNTDDGRLSMRQRRIEELMRINEHEQQFQNQEQKQEQEHQEQEHQEQYEEEQYEEEQQPSQMTQAFYYYYYMMQIEQREMDEITEAIDEEDAWSQHLEQIEQECDFCEDVAGEQEQEETFNVDYEYVKMLELELAKIRANL